jgi:hypothetical protein
MDAMLLLLLRRTFCHDAPYRLQLPQLPLTE